MDAVRQGPDHRLTARSACSLAMTLIQGRSVTPMDFEQELRADPAPEGSPRKDSSRRAAFRNACSYLEGCGFVLEPDPSRRGAVRIDRRATLASVAGLEALDEESGLLEDLGHILVALADAFEGSSAVEAHGAAAKLLRDFALNGLRRELAPATTRDQRILRDAMAGNYRVMATYRREDGREIKRILEPLRHVHVEGRDFLVAVDCGDGVAKTFHYDRFSKVSALGDPFTPRELDLGNLFNPPFGYVRDPGVEPVPADVAFLVPAEREAAVRTELGRLLCSGSGIWESADGGSGDLLWTVHGEDPARAASFALRLGIEVRSPLPYRAAYLDAIGAAREAFGSNQGERGERGERS